MSGMAGSRQRGVITLAVALAILVLSTLATFAVSRAVMVEQKVVNNGLRAVQAFEVAEAGLQQAYVTLESHTLELGRAMAVVTVTDLSGDMRHLRIQSQGFADDRSTSRSLTQDLVALDALPRLPDSPLIVRDKVEVAGMLAVYSPEGPIATGEDVVGNDALLAAMTPQELFRHFFGLPPQAYHQSLVGMDAAIIWVDGDLSLGEGAPGCAACSADKQSPGIFIVNGDLDLVGTLQMYGLLFVLGNLRISGVAGIHGAVIVAGSMNVSAGRVDVQYDPEVLQAAGHSGIFAISAGSWKDF